MDLHNRTHLLLSLSLFSFIFSYSTTYSCLIHSLKFYLSIFSSHILDKNCIFIICNGILVFLAKTSGLIRFSPAISEPNVTLSNSIIEKEVMEEYIRVEDENQDLNLILEDNKIDVEVEDGPKGEEKGGKCNAQDAEGYELNLDTIDKEKAMKEEEEEEVEVEGNDLLTSEDLNKKFDDFIRKMREEFRTGAQHNSFMT